MHTIILNGSPRGAQGNSQIIIEKFLEGYSLNNDTYQQFCVSPKNEWKNIAEAIKNSEYTVVVFPLYAELLPGILLEFFDYLSQTELSQKNTLSFILHSGNLLAGIKGCCNKYLEQLTKSLGCKFGGVLIRGNSFIYSSISKDKANELVKPYAKMGQYFNETKSFFGPEVKEFAGKIQIEKSEARIIDRMCTFLMTEFAERANCKFPLDHKPYDTE